MSDIAPNIELPSDPLEFSEPDHRASEYMRLALPFLVKHRMPPNPLNYAVAYAYQSGRSRKLREHLDDLLARGEPLTPEVSKDLFRRFIFNCDERLMEQYREDLLRIVAETLGSLTDFAGKTSLSSETLETHAARLASSNKMKDVLGIVAEVIAETRSLANGARTLEAHLAATADEVQSLREELARVKEEAVTDALTGVLNRRAFERALDEYAAVSKVALPLFGLLLVDIDHFKKVNDTYGHIIGDKVLRSVAELLTRTVKGRDQVARIGGEEFAVLLPDTKLTGAMSVAEDIRERVEKSRLRRVDTGQVLTDVTVSLGVAVYRKGESPEDLFHRCDQALYKAKRNGRNRVALAD